MKIPLNWSVMCVQCSVSLGGGVVREMWPETAINSSGSGEEMSDSTDDDMQQDQHRQYEQRSRHDRPCT